MAVKTYNTIQGDMWDGIAKKLLGSEVFMDKLIDTNPNYRETVIFSANVTLTIPDITPVTSAPTLPPWKRGGSS